MTTCVKSIRRFLKPIRCRRDLRPDDAAQRLIARISAAVVDVPRVDGKNDAVLVERDAGVAEGALVAVRARGHVLGARLRPLDGRALSFARSQRADRHLRIVGDLDAEAAANVVCLHAHLVHAQVQRRRQQLDADGWERIVAPEIQALVVVVPLRDDGIVFQRRAGEAMHVQMIDVDDVRGFGESLLHVAIFEDAMPDYVRPHGCVEYRFVSGGDLAVNHGREGLVFDAHELGGIFRDGGSFGDDRGDRLALIAHTVDGHGVVENAIAGSGPDLEERIDRAWKFPAPVKVQTTPGPLGFGYVDREDVGMSVWRAHEDEVEHAEQLDVVDKFAFAADQARVFLALDRLADPVSGLIMGCRCHVGLPGLKPLRLRDRYSPG